MVNRTTHNTLKGAKDAARASGNGAPVKRLHEEVQRGVVNATYMGPFEDRISLLDTGRMSTNEAEARLKNIASRYNLTDLLKSISHL